MSRITLHDQRSIVDDMAWGSESVMYKNKAAFSAEICPRAVRLLVVTPPKFLSPFFHQILRRAACKEPEPNNRMYWEEVKRITKSFPYDTQVTNAYVDCMMDYVRELSPAAQSIFRGNESQYFALCFLDPPVEELNLPQVTPDVTPEIMGLLHGMHAYFCDDIETAQLAMTSLLFWLAEWEVNDRLGLTRAALNIPLFLSVYHMGDWLLLVGSHSHAELRRRFYEWLPRHVRAYSFEEYDERCAIVRNDPVMLVALLNRLPKRFPPGTLFEEQFIKAIYKDDYPVPPDVGRQALAFFCKNVMIVWVMCSWPRARIIQKRLVWLSRTGWTARLSDYKTMVNNAMKIK